jgi:hypothetical protein
MEDRRNGRPRRQTSATRVQAVIVTAAMDEWMRRRGVPDAASKGCSRRSWTPGSKMRSRPKSQVCAPSSCLRESLPREHRTGVSAPCATTPTGRLPMSRACAAAQRGRRPYRLVRCPPPKHGIAARQLTGPFQRFHRFLPYPHIMDGRIWRSPWKTPVTFRTPADQLI